MQKANTFELVFLKKEKVGHDTYSFYFDRKNTNFKFTSGQYVKLFLDIKNPDSRGSSRYFTISSSSSEKEFLTITTNIIKSSFKLALFDLKPGDRLKIFGPVGYFNFDPKSKKQNIFIAAGIGITPYHSILKNLESTDLNPKINLFVSFKKMEDAIFYKELKEIEGKKSEVKVIYSLTNEIKKFPNFELERIDIGMINKYVQDYREANYFLVGSESFVNEMFEHLKVNGIPEVNIFKEDFPGY